MQESDHVLDAQGLEAETMEGHCRMHTFYENLLARICAQLVLAVTL